MISLVNAFHDIADGYYTNCRDWLMVEEALRNYEKILEELKQENLPQHSIQVIRNITGV